MAALKVRDDTFVGTVGELTNIASKKLDPVTAPVWPFARTARGGATVRGRPTAEDCVWAFAAYLEPATGDSPGAGSTSERSPMFAVVSTAAAELRLSVLSPRLMHPNGAWRGGRPRR